MPLAPCDLPDDVESLRAIIAAQACALSAQAIQLQSHHLLIEKLKAQQALLRRGRFGRSLEKIDRTIGQLELALEDLETAATEATAPIPAAATF